MAQAPLINFRDGSGSAQAVVFTTNLEFIVLTGTVQTDIVALQISINGAGFVSDNTLTFLDLINWTVPNLTSLPDGLPLELGVNTIEIRAIDIVGGVSPVSTATITRIEEFEEVSALIPTGILLKRRRDSVDIQVTRPEAVLPQGMGEDVTDFNFIGFNYYASKDPGGTSGYFKVNNTPVSTVTTFEEDLIQEVETNTVPFTVEGRFLRVRVTQEDEFGEEVALVSDTLSDIIEFATDLRFTQKLDNIRITEFIFFRHNRQAGTAQNTINGDLFADVPFGEPLFYVVTGVFFNPVDQSEFETPFSQEVLGAPLIIDTNVQDLPGRSQLQIVIDFVNAIQRVNTEIALIPGSTTRDVEIDPFSSEAERIWFLIDFVHRSQSFITLLQVDDANGDGITDLVSESAYKQALKAALGLSTDQAVQNIIDTQFDKLAKNFEKDRLPGRPSVGQVVFFTETRPTQDITIASGTITSSSADPELNLPAVRFVVGGTFVLPAADADAFFNFDTRRFEIIADITAESAGSTGNVTAGKIVNVEAGVGGLQVINTEATVFGNDRESNGDLATRATLGFVSVDAGTEGGYAATSAGQVGILKAKIVKSGDPLMMRDYDDVRRKHIGGKVDIWVQGLRERTVTDTFAFTFDIARDIRVQIIDLPNLIFRVLDSRVTPDTPIQEILDNPVQGLGVRNVTSGLDYDLTGVVILDFETFQINTAIAQPATFIDDIITADYRFRSVNQFFLTLQPVRRVTSVVGEISGALTTDGWDLFKTDDPLLIGESTIATDFVEITQVGGIPSGDTITVTDEPHVLIGFFRNPLLSIGINTATIRVFNEARTVEFNRPDVVDPDYEIIPGTATTPVKIVRTAASQIVSGETVSVDYNHDENFAVTYVINDLLQELQRRVDVKSHVTADVLVKQAILNSIDIETTIQLKQGASKDKTDPGVRTNVSVELNQKLIGAGSAQSDIINATDSTVGVDFQVIPLAQMGYADTSRKMREPVLSSNERVPSLDIGGNQVFILTNPLRFPTTDGGGLETEHKGVFQDDEAMLLSTSIALVGQNANQAFIIGNDGAIITGLSDDATLIADGFDDPDEITAERLERTANKVLLSLSGAGVPPDDPEDHVYRVSYVVRNDVGPHDITASQVEFLDLGNLTLTFREAVTPT